MMTIATRLYTLFNGHLIGADQFGNRYYTEKFQPEGRRQRRWVIYKGLAEPTKVPPEWHGWLHYTIEWPPTQRSIKRYAWEKPHQPNLTGTKGAYVPPGHLLAGAQRDPTTADYEAWKP